MTGPQEFYPRYIPDKNKPNFVRRVENEAQHKALHPEDHAKLVDEIRNTQAKRTQSMADDDYRRGYFDGASEQVAKDATIAETFPRAGKIGRDIASQIRNLGQPVPPESSEVAQAVKEQEAKPEPQKEAEPESVPESLQPQWGDD